MSRRNISYSCPDFDAAISSIEAARKINDQLRDALSEEEDARKEADERADDLEQQLKDASRRIEELESELADREKTAA